MIAKGNLGAAVILTKINQRCDMVFMKRDAPLSDWMES